MNPDARIVDALDQEIRATNLDRAGVMARELEQRHVPLRGLECDVHHLAPVLPVRVCTCGRPFSRFIR